MSYHTTTGRDRQQRRPADPGRRPGREARGRPQAAPDDRGDRRRRDPGDGPPRPHPAVGPRHGRLQGAGPGARRRAGAGGRRQGARRRRLLRHRARGRARRGGPHGHRRRRRAHDRHRRRRRHRRAGARVPRRARHRGPHPAEVRAPLRRPEGRPASTRCRPTPPTCAPGAFPGEAETYHLSAEVAETLGSTAWPPSASEARWRAVPVAHDAGRTCRCACLAAGASSSSRSGCGAFVRARAPTARPMPELGAPLGPLPPAGRRRPANPDRVLLDGLRRGGDHGRSRRRHRPCWRGACWPR